MISILIVDDDLYKISKIIESIQKNLSEQIEIKQASCVSEAIEYLHDAHFHLLVTDLLMPLRNGEQPIAEGGDILVKEIYKAKNKLNVPIYILGLTQYSELEHKFNKIWRVLNYESNNIAWENQLRDLLFHISKIDSKIVKQKRETIFVEGSTDKAVLSTAFALFHPKVIDKFNIETLKFGAGSSWVERQLVIWGKSLFRKYDETYLQAVGIFDLDKAGKIAIEDLNKQISIDSAARTTFSTISLDKKFANHLIPLYKAGLYLPITLEEMYSPGCWQHAFKHNWLQQRILTDEILEFPQKWDKTNQSLTNYIDSLELSEEAILFIKYKVKEDCKPQFSQYIMNLLESERKEALLAFKSLIDVILEKLKV